MPVGFSESKSCLLTTPIIEIIKDEEKEENFDFFPPVVLLVQVATSLCLPVPEAEGTRQCSKNSSQ